MPQSQEANTNNKVEIKNNRTSPKRFASQPVIGIEMGTGSAFSLLPTQNATGNWIKVVQRVPVRIQLDPQQLAENPLRIGLSATVKVNVSDSQGETLRNQAPSTALYSTNVLQYDESAVNNLIESIIRDNSY